MRWWENDRRLMKKNARDRQRRYGMSTDNVRHKPTIYAGAKVLEAAYQKPMAWEGREGEV
jgi:hypothetical protein